MRKLLFWVFVALVGRAVVVPDDLNDVYEEG